MLSKLIDRQDFSEENYSKVRKELMSYYVLNHEDMLRNINDELEMISKEANKVLGRHKKDVLNVADHVDEDIESSSPELVLGNLRKSLREIVESFEKDRQQFKHLLHEDSLTRVASRRFFDLYLNDTIDLWNCAHKPASLMLIDVDNFKNFNDDYGHLIGDQVLRSLAKLMHKNLNSFAPNRYDSLLARYGGDEFAIMLRGDLALKSHQIADFIRKKVAASKLVLRNTNGDIVHKDIKATVSIGVANFDFNVQVMDKSIIIDSADKALYYAKSKGRDCVAAIVKVKPPSYKLYK